MYRCYGVHFIMYSCMYTKINNIYMRELKFFFYKFQKKNVVGLASKQAHVHCTLYTVQCCTTVYAVIKMLILFS